MYKIANTTLTVLQQRDKLWGHANLFFSAIGKCAVWTPLGAVVHVCLDQIQIHIVTKLRINEQQGRNPSTPTVLERSSKETT